MRDQSGLRSTQSNTDTRKWISDDLPFLKEREAEILAHESSFASGRYYYQGEKYFCVNYLSFGSAKYWRHVDKRDSSFILQQKFDPFPDRDPENVSLPDPRLSNLINGADKVKFLPAIETPIGAEERTYSASFNGIVITPEDCLVTQDKKYFIAGDERILLDLHSRGGGYSETADFAVSLAKFRISLGMFFPTETNTSQTTALQNISKNLETQ